MKVIKMSIAAIVCILAVTAIMIPVLNDTVPHDTVYDNVPEGGVLYTYYNGTASIPSITITTNQSGDVLVNGQIAETDVHTPAIVTSNLSIAPQAGSTGVTVTHTNIATLVGEGTAYPSQITKVNDIDLTVTGGKISGTVKTSGGATYTIAETTLGWAYVQSSTGTYTAVDQTAGDVYVASIADLTWQYRVGSNDTHTVHDGKMTDKTGTNPTDLTDASFTAVTTEYSKGDVTILKVTMPPVSYKSTSVAWAIAPASYTIDDHEETREEKIIALVPLLTMVGLVLAIVGTAMSRRSD